MPPQQQQLDQDIVRLARAVRKIESGDNFNARGGSGEYGGYQYTEPTWNAQARAAGVNVPYNQASRADQNKVFYTWAKAQKDAGKNIGQIASMHNAGEGRPNAYLEGNAGTNKYGVSYDTKAYATKVAQEYQKLKQVGDNYQVPQDNYVPPDAPAPQQEEPKGDFLSGASNFLNSIFPAKNIGNVIGTQIAKLNATPEERQYIKDDASLGGVVGDVAQNAAWFVGGGAVPAVRGATAASRVLPGIAAGAKYGAAAGALGGAGRALSDGGDLMNAAGGAIQGGLTGGLTGGVLGGAVPMIPGIAGRMASGGVRSNASIVEDMVARNAAGKTAGGAEAALARNNQLGETAAGKILQGTTQDAAMGARVIPTVDTKGVKTYEDFNRRIQQDIDKNLSIVDRELAADKKLRKASELTQKVSAGDGSKLSLKVNYVEDALDQLRKYYTATRDIKQSLEVKALMAKAKKEGLTLTEINEIARRHGRDLNGFNANGELASGLSKQAAENTRKGLKDTARSFLKTDVAKQADKATSDLIKVQKLVSDMEEKVNKLEQRVKKRGIMEKLGRALGDTVDMATLGSLKGFLARLVPSNVGLKTLNSLDLEKQLEKNLKLLDRLNAAPDSEVEAVLRRIIGGTLDTK